ncbi:MAG: phosphatase PAP2 family protein [Tannerella sp.]|nr:phosphatase PAP2 family protein [Tannerella sp.]
MKVKSEKQKMMLCKRNFYLILICLISPVYVAAQESKLPPPTMKSPGLITLSDFHPGKVYGDSYEEMLKQRQGSKTKKNLFNGKGSKFIIPAIFIAYGTAARFDELPVRQWDYDINNEIRKRAGKHLPVDNYLEVATPLLAFGLDFIPGIESRHNLRDRTLIMATSYLITGAVVWTIKETVPVVRPRGWLDDAFPSGHTAIAMTGAHIMYKEYKDVSPWIGISGYVMAAGTGFFRMHNNAHWFSDVVMGAGAGLLSAEIGYMMLPVWHTLFGFESGDRAISALPVIGVQNYGIAFVYQF